MRPSRCILLVTVFLALAATSFRSAQSAPAPPDLKDKIVLANPAKYRVILRFGSTQRMLESRKANVLSPKRYPVTIEFFSGKRTTGWLKQQVTSAGIYDFRWQGGQWSLTRRPSRTAVRSSNHLSHPVRSSTSYRRSTGSYQRTVQPTYVRRRPAYMPRARYYGTAYPRWSYWTRGVWGLAKLYQFARDEEDRDIIRDIIIGREVDDAVRRDIEDAIRDRLVAMPFEERRDLERAIDDISRLDPDDWKEITTLPTDDWDRLREDIGDEIDDADWEGLGGWVDTLDEPPGGVDADLGDLDIDTMDENLDLGALDDLTGGLEGNMADLDLDYGQDIEDFEMGDLLGGAETLDLSDFDDGGYGGGWDLDELQGGDLGGGWGDAGGYDFDPGGYDMGGFDDWGGGFDDFGGGFDDFGGGDFFDF